MYSMCDDHAEFTLCVMLGLPPKRDHEFSAKFCII